MAMIFLRDVMWWVFIKARQSIMTVEQPLLSENDVFNISCSLANSVLRGLGAKVVTHVDRATPFVPNPR